MQSSLHPAQALKSRGSSNKCQQYIPCTPVIQGVPVVYMRLHLAVALLLAVAQRVIYIFVRRQLHPVAANLCPQCSQLTRLFHENG